MSVLLIVLALNVRQPATSPLYAFKIISKRILKVKQYKKATVTNTDAFFRTKLGAASVMRRSICPSNYLLSTLSRMSFTCDAITSLVRISSPILSRACITVVWSRPPKYSPTDISGMLVPMMSQTRYMAI